MSEASATVATSRRNTVGNPGRMGTRSSSPILFTTELRGVIGIRSPTRTLPEGLMVFVAATADTTSSGDRLYARRRSGSTRTTTVRWLGPKGGGADTPGGGGKGGGPPLGRG